MDMNTLEIDFELIEAIAALVDEDNPEFFTRQAQDLVTRMDEAAVAFSTARESGNRQELKAHAHAIGGACANFGGISVAAACTQLEIGADFMSDRDIHNLIELIKSQMAAFAKFIKAESSQQAAP